ncbi:MAG: HlyD family efflux transporter periplasmic adaptor subunit [Deltaproteobacteria bacterium]|nr:HlyD family efflux transporter periplasmic adaptor subunit [Deltaproteobacteria bacterium]
MNGTRPTHVEAPHALVTRDRRCPETASDFVRSFDCAGRGVLIICRGPIRKEALDVFAELGMDPVGILLSEKDSIVYPGALAPELRQLSPERVHHVPDYGGATGEERRERVTQILAIAKRHGYEAIFAGYGFMAEEAELAAAIEQAGLIFIGPGSSVQRAAGKKDEAKRTALANGVSVTPGVDDLTRRTLLRAHSTEDALAELASAHGLTLRGDSVEDKADALLADACASGQDLFSIDDLAREAGRVVDELTRERPGKRFRLKAIGGGGGKGQRIVESATEAAEKVHEVLSEVKATGVGDDKNLLVELNVEQTRHHEVQLLGNGEWCVSLGGRDCSLQMHEQKLLELSITEEELRAAETTAREAGDSKVADAIAQDRATLAKMEAEAVRFGAAVGLDSASTFECIIDGVDHYFMEVNTRIQVEHRVSELCYALRFENPDDADDALVVDSLVEAMVRVAFHGAHLPKPTRVRREGAAIEARLNATNDALEPHAGGRIRSWTSRIDSEIRDDQGISRRNPDTGLFSHYRLAGAYDSNIALLLTTGDTREQSFERLSEILRRTKLRGEDLATNLAFHYGLVSFLRSQHVWAKPTTRFVRGWLTQVGLLAESAQAVDVQAAFHALGDRLVARAADAAEAASATRGVIAAKQTLVTRPLELLLSQPHLAAAWLSIFRQSFEVDADGVRWLENPVRVLERSYHLLNMERRDDQPAAFVIWPQDHELLERALGFYARLESRLDEKSAGEWSELRGRLDSEHPPAGFDEALWRQVREADAGHQRGLELLGLLPLLAREVDFFELSLEDDLSFKLPERLFDEALVERARRALSPPPPTSANEIVSVSGGMYYAREAPERPELIQAGEHFEAGQPLYVIEVMKMFNKVKAPFAGTVDELLIDTDGQIVKKGQPLFRVTPDEAVVEVDHAAEAKERAQHGREFAARLV